MGLEREREIKEEGEGGRKGGRMEGQMERTNKKKDEHESRKEGRKGKELKNNDSIAHCTSQLAT